MTNPRLENQLCFALYSASNYLTGVYRPLLNPLGITYTQFIVLMALWEEDNITITSLASKTGLSKPTMTPLLKRLELKKLIVRKVPEDNERMKKILLTKAGRRLSQKSKALTHKAFCASGLTKKQANDMIQVCHKMVQNYDAT